MIKETRNLIYFPSDRKFSHPDEWEELEFDQYVTLPNSSHGFATKHGSIYYDLTTTPKINRLNCISHCGKVSVNPYPLSLENSSVGLHSYYTALMMEYVLDMLGRDQDEINLGVASSFLHDAALPPFADQGKFASMDDLDEEKNIEYVLDDRDIRRILDKHAISREDVTSCVRGEHGLVGQLLNSRYGIDLDGISYTMLESSLTDGPHRVILGQDPYLLDLFESIQTVDDVPVFTNKERLRKFLMVRAEMFRNFYHSPSNRAFEAFLGEMFRGLWDKGILTKESLLEMNDSHLENLMKEVVPVEMQYPLFRSFSKDCFQEIGRYDKTPDGRIEAQKDLEEEKEQNPDREYLLKEHGSFKTGTRTLVDVPGGVDEFRNVFPAYTVLIEGIAMDLEYIGLYEFDSDEI